MSKTASRKRHCGNSFVPLIHTESSREKSTSSCSKCSAKVWKPGAAGAALIFTAIVSTACCGPRRGARLTAITNGGAIPDTADYDVIEFPSETFVGKVHEDFAIESLGRRYFSARESFLAHPPRRLGQSSWSKTPRALPPTIPFWMGEAPGRTLELSKAVADLREDVAAKLADRAGAAQWLIEEGSMPPSAAEQIVNYVGETVATLGTVPSQEKIIAERFFDEAGGMQLILHSPWGGRINRAWGLALRKRFCVSFDRELQAAATDDGICISLVEQHSFPLSDVFLMLKPAMLEENLTQAALVSPMFDNRWRWNATRALAIQRHSGGRKVPVALQRMRAEDLLAAVFPEQVMCQDNRTGPVELPDHPLVKETIGDCLHEAMDMDGLAQILARIESGAIETLAIDTPAPSPMAHEILNANPYAFLGRRAAGRTARAGGVAAPCRSVAGPRIRPARSSGDRRSAQTGMARSAQSGRITRSLARRRVIARRTAARLAGISRRVD